MDKPVDMLRNVAKLSNKKLKNLFVDGYGCVIRCSWNPLEDSGKAFELALAQAIVVVPEVGPEGGRVYAYYGTGQYVIVYYGDNSEHYCKDIDSAARFAIVWAASELQKAKDGNTDKS